MQKLYFAKDGSRDSAVIRIQPLSQAAKPIADPAGKEFMVQLDVTLASATSGAVIHYTLDGTAPTEASPIFTAPIHLTATTAPRGYYQDKDDGGRIETAVLLFDDAFVLPPRSLWLTADLNALGPTWKVTTRYPFRYTLAFFDNLGQFVNRAEGTVTDEQLARVQATISPGDSTHLELTFLPIAADGNTIATGAYIMKGTLTILNQPVYKGRQGEDLVVTPVSTTMVSRFGFIRQ